MKIDPKRLAVRRLLVEQSQLFAHLAANMDDRPLMCPEHAPVFLALHHAAAQNDNTACGSCFEQILQKLGLALSKSGPAVLPHKRSHGHVDARFEESVGVYERSLKECRSQKPYGGLCEEAHAERRKSACRQQCLVVSSLSELNYLPFPTHAYRQ